jgi:hypothetical protein
VDLESETRYPRKPNLGNPPYMVPRMRSPRHGQVPRGRAQAIWSTALAAALCLLLVAPAAGGAAANTPADGRWRPREPSAIIAGALQAKDSAKLHYVKSSGSTLYEEGTAHGTLPGSMRAYCDLGSTFTANFTIYTDGSTIKGHGTATPHGSGIYESFAGTLLVTGGTGRYLHAHGRAGLYGTFDRRTYAMTVQTTGSLSY